MASETKVQAFYAIGEHARARRRRARPADLWHLGWLQTPTEVSPALTDHLQTCRDAGLLLAVMTDQCILSCQCCCSCPRAPASTSSPSRRTCGEDFLKKTKQKHCFNTCTEMHTRCEIICGSFAAGMRPTLGRWEAIILTALSSSMFIHLWARWGTTLESSFTLTGYFIKHIYWYTGTKSLNAPRCRLGAKLTPGIGFSNPPYPVCPKNIIGDESRSHFSLSLRETPSRLYLVFVPLVYIFIHPSITYTAYLVWVVGKMEPVPADCG